SLNVMGDKIRSKNHVTGYGVPVVPGIAEPGMSDAQLVEAAAGVGYPLLIKPSAGGGGKGMHVVERPEGLEATLAIARRVAASAFGDDTLFLERLVSTPRHIEVQVLADNHGNVIHLGERECSLQRRHQKVIEEAPSPLLESLPDGAAIRARIGEAACNTARSVNYSGAGTVEFLVSDNAPDEFFFMEMNTRLQVEHPVTEMVTGIDLVEWQVRIAAGEELTVRQDDVVLTGHSVEARVYAEVPAKNFLPSIGQVVLLDELPDAADGKIRVDSALLEGLQISSSYDPMISKVIAWGEDRAEALDTLDRALAGYTALGIDTNVEYLRLLINDADVRAGRLDTGLIERKMPEFTFRHADDFEVAAAAVFAAAMHERETQDAGASPWHLRGGWRLGAAAPLRISLGMPDGGIATVDVFGSLAQGTAAVAVNGGPRQPASMGSDRRGHAEWTLGGESRTYALVPVHRGSVPPGPGNPMPTEIFLGNGGWSCRLEVLTREARLARVLAAVEREEGAADPAVRSPMPGTVVSVSVSNGDIVEAGQVLLSVEAMKMEHQLVAPLDGTVHISAATGDLVKADQVLATVHPAVPDEPSKAEDTIEEAVIAMGAAD
ncbi:MAG TPA: biotin/lipoyl-containing protein, partial [Arthrobacter sp.]|nr:biotin/lipoyl-containing protein [Arthrobacter sp.]